MTENELRTLAAAIILAGLYAGGNTASRDYEVRESILLTDTLLEALKNPAPLNKRIEDARNRRAASNMRALASME